MTDPSGFAKLVPGFDFLQDLVKNAGSALPNMGQWVAPTLNPEELEKRIDELRTVQFWLEQNARMLGATIQALEVQRMTLSTLKTMNVQMGDLRDSLKIKVPETPSVAAPQAAPPEPEPADPQKKAAGAVDPMQWWGALTKQFTELAASALKDSPVAAPKAGATRKPAAAKKKAAAKSAPRAAAKKRAAPNPR